MVLTISLVLAAISIGLLAIYGADVAAGGTEAGGGFLPFSAMERGIGFGGPPIALSIAAFFISRKESSKILGIMIVITGILIIIGGATSFALMGENTDNTARVAGEGGSLIAIGGFVTALGGIKIKRS